MSMMKFARVTSLPTIPDQDTMYLVKSENAGDAFDLYISGNTPGILKRVAQYPSITSFTTTNVDSAAITLSTTVSFLAGFSYERTSVYFYYKKVIDTAWTAVNNDMTFINGTTFGTIVYPLDPNVAYQFKCKFVDNLDPNMEIDSQVIQVTTLNPQMDANSQLYLGGYSLNAGSLILDANATLNTNANGQNYIIASDQSLVKSIPFNQQVGENDFTGIQVGVTLKELVCYLQPYQGLLNEMIVCDCPKVPAFMASGKSITITDVSGVNTSANITGVAVQQLEVPGNSIFNSYYCDKNTLTGLTYTTSPTSPNVLNGSTYFTTNSKVYCIGGINTGNVGVNTIWSCNINPDGTLDNVWVTDTNTFPITYLQDAQVFINNNIVYVVGGYTAQNYSTYTSLGSYGTFSNAIYTATLNPDGTVGVFTLKATLTLAVAANYAISFNNGMFYYLQKGSTGNVNGSYTMNYFTVTVNPDSSLTQSTSATPYVTLTPSAYYSFNLPLFFKSGLAYTYANTNNNNNVYSILKFSVAVDGTLTTSSILDNIPCPANIMGGIIPLFNLNDVIMSTKNTLYFFYTGAQVLTFNDDLTFNDIASLPNPSATQLCNANGRVFTNNFIYFFNQYASGYYGMATATSATSSLPLNTWYNQTNYGLTPVTVATLDVTLTNNPVYARTNYLSVFADYGADSLSMARAILTNPVITVNENNGYSTYEYAFLPITGRTFDVGAMIDDQTTILEIKADLKNTA